MDHISPRHASLGIALFILIAIAYGIFHGVTLPTMSAHTPTTASHDTMPPPPLTSEVRAQLEVSKGFSVLVSYTDRGFEPTSITVHAGDTVRFVNNSSNELWVASKNPPAYPGSSSCGGSRFDTCKALKHGEFWEFTFDTKGTWTYHNNSDTEKAGAVVVK